MKEGPRLARGPFPFLAHGKKLFLRAIEEFSGFIPIDHVPPGLDVIPAPVLILQVVGVFPDVESQNGLASTSQQIGSVLIRRRVNSQLPVSDDQPGPAGTKAPQARGCEFFLKSRERSKRGIDGRCKASFGLSATSFLHQRPEKRVVPVAAAVVADGAPNILRK